MFQNNLMRLCAPHFPSVYSGVGNAKKLCELFLAKAKPEPKLSNLLSE